MLLQSGLHTEALRTVLTLVILDFQMDIIYVSTAHVVARAAEPTNPAYVHLGVYHGPVGVEGAHRSESLDTLGAIVILVTR